MRVIARLANIARWDMRVSTKDRKIRLKSKPQYKAKIAKKERKEKTWLAFKIVSGAIGDCQTGRQPQFLSARRLLKYPSRQIIGAKGNTASVTTVKRAALPFLRVYRCHRAKLKAMSTSEHRWKFLERDIERRGEAVNQKQNYGLLPCKRIGNEGYEEWRRIKKFITTVIAITDSGRTQKSPTMLPRCSDFYVIALPLPTEVGRHTCWTRWWVSASVHKYADTGTEYGSRFPLHRGHHSLWCRPFLCERRALVNHSPTIAQPSA